MKELDKTSTIELRRFYVRRAYRILPAAIVFMVVVFVMFWQELRWYHMAAAALYLVNYNFAHPWFLGHLWSLSVQEQFYFLWPGGLKRWYRHRVRIAIGAIAVAPLFRILGHLLRLHGRGDEAFPAVADIPAIGCLLALFWKRVPKARAWCAALMLVPVVLVPVYMGVLKFHVTAVLLLALWPVMHFSIAGLLLYVGQTPYRILNFGPVVWLGKMSYSLYLWQQLFTFGEHPRPWYFPILAVGWRPRELGSLCGGGGGSAVPTARSIPGATRQGYYQTSLRDSPICVRGLPIASVPGFTFRLISSFGVRRRIFSCAPTGLGLR